jgi:hypothetical protein
VEKYKSDLVQAIHPRRRVAPGVRRSAREEREFARAAFTRLFDPINLRHSERRSCFHAHATCPDFCRWYGTQDSRPEGTGHFDETSPSTPLEKAGRGWTAEPGRAPKDNFQYPLGLQPFSFRLKFGANQTETVAKPF